MQRGFSVKRVQKTTCGQSMEKTLLDKLFATTDFDMTLLNNLTELDGNISLPFFNGSFGWNRLQSRLFHVN